MAANSKNTRMQSRLEKAARENHNLSVDYEVQAKIIREKTARLKALRLAKKRPRRKTRALKLSASTMRTSELSPATCMRGDFLNTDHISIRRAAGRKRGQWRLLAQSGHRLVRCTCLLLTQSGQAPPLFT